MALELAWDFDWNRAIDGVDNLTTGSNFLYAWKRLLCDIGSAPSRWTVLSSSNGTLTGAADHWASAADVVFANAGTAHSWVELISPVDYPTAGVRTRLVLDAANAVGYQASFVLASAAQTGAGTLLARPTYAAGNAFTWTALQVFPGYIGTSVNYFHGSRSATGDFVITTSRAGFATLSTAANPFGMIVSKLDAAHPAGTDPWPLYIFAGFFVGDDPTAFGPFVLNRSGASRMGNTTYSKMFWIDGTAAAWQIAPCALTAEGGSLNKPVAAEFSFAGDIIDGSYPYLPLFILAWAGTLGTNRGTVRGRLIDLTGAPFGGDTGYPTQGVGSPVGAVERVLLGQLWIPGNAEPIV